MPEDQVLYKAVGKAFLLKSKATILSGLEEELSTLTKNQRDLLDRKEYLERRVTSNRSNMAELTA